MSHAAYQLQSPFCAEKLTYPHRRHDSHRAMQSLRFEALAPSPFQKPWWPSSQSLRTKRGTLRRGVQPTHPGCWEAHVLVIVIPQ